MIAVDSIAALKKHGITRIAVACGVFDGLHLGHQQILTMLKETAAAHDAASVVVTFAPHPMKVLAPEQAPLLIYSYEHKLSMFSRLGIDAAVVMPFTREFAGLPPVQFLDEMLFGQGVELTAISVGSAWRFGRQAEGDVDLLTQEGRKRGADVIAVPEIDLNGETVSSTRIREVLAAGDLAKVNTLMGRPFSIYGDVRHGKGIATSELHYPTANIAANNEIFPPCGIYAANALLFEDSVTRLPGVMYLGNAPTYVNNAPDKPFVEVHIFDFHQDIYDRKLEVEFLEFIRGDKKFSSSEALSEQISRDIAVAHRIHNVK